MKISIDADQIVEGLTWQDMVRLFLAKFKEGNLSNDEITKFIISIDSELANWSITADLAEHFNNEVLQYLRDNSKFDDNGRTI